MPIQNTKVKSLGKSGFLFENDHPYAVSMVIEEGGAGGNLAAETAAKALKYAIQYVG